MIESGYYPPGAEFDPSAPYNQVDTPEKDFEVTVSNTLSKYTTVTTNKYDHYIEEGVDEWDEFDHVDWKEEFQEEHYAIPQLLDFLQEYIEKDLQYEDSKYSKRQLKRMLEDCQGWVEDELEVIKD